jgi:hypothetical protein
MEMSEINAVRKQPPSGSHFTAIGLVPPVALDTLGLHRLPYQAPKESVMQIRSVVVLASLGLASLAHGQQAVQWRIQDGGNGHWYGVVVSPSIGNSQESARVLAHQQGAELATFSSMNEWSFASSEVIANDSMGPNPKTMYLGGVLINNTWQWLDGSEWPANAPWFAPGECPGIASPNGDGTAMQSFCFGRYWDDRPSVGGGALNKALFEWSADCNGDDIVDYGQILDGTFEDANENGVPDCCDAGESCTPCPGDVNDSGIVNGTDIAIILGAWGTSGGKFPRSDTDGNGIVDAADLAVVLGGWGPCP